MHIPALSQKAQTLELLRANRRVLELMAKNRPLNEILHGIARLIENSAEGCMGAVYFVENGQLRLGAAPSFPEEFAKLIDGAPVGPESGVCGTAAHSGMQVISSDVEADECWGSYRDFVFSQGIRSAWSTPIVSDAGMVHATVTMAWKEKRTPTDWDLEIMESARELMAIAVDRRKDEELIEEQRLKLASASKLAALGEMSANLAHEINNPLAIIQSHTDQLRLLANLGRMDTAQAIRTADEIGKTIERMTKIIRGLKTISKDADHDPIEQVPVATILENTLAFCTQRFAKNGIHLDITPPPVDLKIHGRPVQISQVLLNLLNNAFDAVKSLPEKWVRIEFTVIGENCLISVIDSGKGIETSLHKRIMDPFFTTKKGAHGTGLGLSISKKIIEAHQGRLTLCTASPNTRFNVEIPLSALEQSQNI